MKKTSYIFIFFFIISTARYFAQIISTHAGNGTAGYLDGATISSNFSAPNSIATHTNGDVYVADSQNNCIRKISSGVVSTFAGNGTFGNTDGIGITATFANPTKITIDNSGNIYVAANDKVRKITPAGVVSTFISSTTFAATLFVYARISEIDFDRTSNTLWIADSSLTFLKSNLAGVVSTTGIGTLGIVKSIWANGIANGCYYTSSNGNVYKVASSGLTSFVATGLNAEGIAFNTVNNFLYIAVGGPNPNKIMIYSPFGGGFIRYQFSGNVGDFDGLSSAAKCNSLNDVFITPTFSNTIYVTDKLNNKIKTIQQTYTPIPLNPISLLTPTAICQGSVFTQSVNSTSATHYNWAINNNALTNTIYITGANTTNLSVSNFSLSQQGTLTVYYGNTYSNDSTSMQITVLTSPSVNVAATNSLICIGSSVILTASNNGSGFGNYMWTTSTGASFMGSSKNVTPTVTTTYSVTGNDLYCPFTNIAAITISVSTCIGINEAQNNNAFTVYPNPANEILNVELTYSTGSNQAILNDNISITNALGEIVLTEKSSHKNFTLKINNLTSGVYFIKIESKQGSVTKKFIKH